MTAAAHAREVIELLRGIRCKVNLIALNPGPGIQFGTPAEQSVQIFKDLLVKAGIPAFVRRPRGTRYLRCLRTVEEDGGVRSTSAVSTQHSAPAHFAQKANLTTGEHG